MCCRHGSNRVGCIVWPKLVISAQHSIVRAVSLAGLCKFANGDKFVGDFAVGTPGGQGKMAYANGDKYDGDWADGKRHGKGTCIYACGEKYCGTSCMS